MEKSASPPLRRVALIIDTSHESGRNELEGIAEYNRMYRPGWILYHRPRGLERLPDDLPAWQGDGIIGRIRSGEWLKILRKKKAPIIDLLGAIEDDGLHRVIPNQAAIGRIAFRHLSEQGFENFAFLGIEGEKWSVHREDAFKREAEISGKNCEIYYLQRLPEDPWEKRMSELAEWFQKLPKPAGVFIVADEFSSEALEACRLAALRIPADVGLVGVDDDRVICCCNQWELSSIKGKHFDVGFKAAKLMDLWFQGEPPPPNTIAEAPTIKDVVIRQSSDLHGQKDPRLISALTYIKGEIQRPGGSPSIIEIVEATGVPAATLSRCFAAAFKMTIHDKILQLRLEKARDLLTKSEQRVEKIAIDCGFSSSSHFGAAFHKAYDLTPKAFRIQEKTKSDGKVETEIHDGSDAV